MSLSRAQVQQFKIDGYLILPNLISRASVEELNAVTQNHLQTRHEPFELEANVHYPGAPKSESAAGGDTIRRLRMAYERHAIYTKMAQLPEILDAIQQILQSETVLLSPSHHNCVMTKQPKFSSATLWHRDTRYWDFSDKYLINAWFALGDELQENGAMKILPGSHRWDVSEHALDEAQFLKPEHPDNQERLATERLICLNAGDVVLFSAHCFHAAGNNQTQTPKFSLIYTYHGESTLPIAGTHSAEGEEIQVR